MEQSSDLSTDEIEAAVRELKYPSAKSLSKTFSDYLEAHSWAISALIKIDSILHYGHTFDDHEPHHVLCLRFKCRREFGVDTTQERDRRPHCAFFLLRSNRFRNLSDWLTAPGDMERIGGRYTRDMRKAHEYYSTSRVAILRTSGSSGYPLPLWGFQSCTTSSSRNTCRILPRLVPGNSASSRNRASWSIS